MRTQIRTRITHGSKPCTDVVRTAGSCLAAILLASQSLPADQLTPIITERGPHHRIEHTPIPEVDWQTGEITGYRTNQIVYLGNGMHFWDGSRWVESEEVIESFPQGAIARKGAYQVIFSPNIAVAGAIDLLTPAEQRLRFHPLALRWANKVTGQRVLIAGIKDAKGKILPPNDVRYEDCFNGLLADLLYCYQKGRFQSDLVLREKPTLPTGWRAEDARIKMVTEFVEAPEPDFLHHVSTARLTQSMIPRVLTTFSM